MTTIFLCEKKYFNNDIRPDVFTSEKFVNIEYLPLIQSKLSNYNLKNYSVVIEIDKIFYVDNLMFYTFEGLYNYLYQFIHQKYYNIKILKHKEFEQFIGYNHGT